MNHNIIIKRFTDLTPQTDKKIGGKPVSIFTKSIKGKNLPKDKLYNSVLGTTHIIIPDILGIDGLCHFFQTLNVTCPHCGVKKTNVEIWATEDYAIMYCNQCKVYTWKHHQSNIEKAYYDTNYKRLKWIMKWATKTFNRSAW